METGKKHTKIEDSGIEDHLLTINTVEQDCYKNKTSRIMGTLRTECSRERVVFDGKTAKHSWVTSREDKN